MIAFGICLVIAVFFEILGICAFCAKKPMGFWANAEVFEVTDVKKYNRAVGKLWCGFGVVLAVTCIPLLTGGQNDPVLLLPVLAIMIEAIAVMVIYTLGIEKKYRKKK